MLVHGFTQTGRSWAGLVGPLTDAGYEVVLVDAPGHGGSAAVRADLPGGAELLGRAGRRATYVGYSMGGRLCLHLALAHGELVEGLVLVGATAGIEDPGERAERRATDEELAASLDPPLTGDAAPTSDTTSSHRVPRSHAPAASNPAAADTPVPGPRARASDVRAPDGTGTPGGDAAANGRPSSGADPEGQRRLDAFLAAWMAKPLFATLAADVAGLADRRGNTPSGLAASLRLAGTGTQANLWGSLSRLSMPTLVVAGALDHKFSSLGHRLASAVGPGANLAVIEGAGHAVHLEQPERFLAALLAFLARTGPATAERPTG